MLQTARDPALYSSAMSPDTEIEMVLEALRQRKTAMNMHEVSALPGLSESLLYRMAAANQIPNLPLSGAVPFDPGQLATGYEARLNPPGRKSVSPERLGIDSLSLPARSA